MLGNDALSAFRLGNEQLIASGQDLDIPGAASLQFQVPRAPSPPPPPPSEDGGYEMSTDVLYDDDEPAFGDCVGCMFGERKYDKVKAPKFALMVELMDAALFSIPNRAAAVQIAEYYESEIRGPILATGGAMPPWPVDGEDGVYDHIFGTDGRSGHMRKNPDVFIASSIEVMDETEEALREAIRWHRRDRDADGLRKTARALVLVNNHNRTLREADTKKMWGYSEAGFRYDPNTRAKLLHYSRIKVTDS